jgi:hypothetical protein
MAHELLIANLRAGLRETRNTRNRRAMELSELETDAAALREEIAALDRIIAQNVGNIERLQTESIAIQQMGSIPSDAELEAALDHDASGPIGSGPFRAPVSGHEPADSRFLDRTIPQATAMILRECGGPLHVNDIYQFLLDGGFKFTGHNPTISIAVSLNRNRRFRKVAPGTFDLVMREAVQVR